MTKKPHFFCIHVESYAGNLGFQNVRALGLLELAQNCNGDYFCHCRYDKLDEEESQQVEFLVFCTSRNVAKAAGEFLKERLVMAADEEVRKASKSKRGEC